MNFASRSTATGEMENTDWHDVKYQAGKFLPSVSTKSTFLRRRIQSTHHKHGDALSALWKSKRWMAQSVNKAVGTLEVVGKKKTCFLSCLRIYKLICRHRKNNWNVSKICSKSYIPQNKPAIWLNIKDIKRKTAKVK